MKKLNLFQVIRNEINLEGRVLSARLENKSREKQTVISSMLPKKEKPDNTHSRRIRKQSKWQINEDREINTE